MEIGKLFLENNNKSMLGAMVPYSKYVKSLIQLVTTSELKNYNEQLHDPLNGEPYKELRSTISLKSRRQSGAFFTDQDLADNFIKQLSSKLNRGAKVIDPACGTGNLLVACAKLLPIKKKLSSTIRYWNNLIFGYDVHPEFVDTSKIRLVMLALSRGAKHDLENINVKEIFSNIVAADSLTILPDITSIDIVVINPPYTRCKLKKNDCEWANGSTSIAALFIDKYVAIARKGTEIIAFLPEVLRTGSLYKKWRSVIESKVMFKNLKVIGLFDAWTDVDIFVASFVVAAKNKFHSHYKSNYWIASIEPKIDQKMLSELFDICVGPVVPHRLQNKGPWRAYIHVKNSPPWGEVDAAQHGERIRYSGKVFTPPFVVIRRTSSPKDSRRAIATIIKGNRDVAVENHLIVLQPKFKTLKECRFILCNLNTDEVDKIINDQMRCRHLTIPVVKKVLIEG